MIFPLVKSITKPLKETIIGIRLSIYHLAIYLYFIVLCLCLLTIFVVRRLQNSRIGRAWIAVREDETASQAMGIDTAKAKRTAFAIGAGWAGMMGVIFAAKTTFINPASFNFIESAMILSIVRRTYEFHLNSNDTGRS